MGFSLNAKEGAWAGDLEDPQRKVTVAKEVAERDVSKRECMPTWGELLCMLFLQHQCACVHATLYSPDWPGPHRDPPLILIVANSVGVTWAPGSQCNISFIHPVKQQNDRHQTRRVSDQRPQVGPENLHFK